jgi:putative DNA primase/helicase
MTQVTAKDYIEHILFGAGDCRPPDDLKPYDAFLSLFEAHQKGTHWRLWEFMKTQKDTKHLKELIGTPALDPKAELDPLPFEEVLTYLEFQETGDANLLEALHHNRLAYDHLTQKWHLWAGNHWQADEIGLPRKLLSGHVRSQYLAAAAKLAMLSANAPSPEEKTRYETQIELCYARARSVCNVGKKKRVLEEAQTNFAASADQWDANAWLLGCINGTIDLKTGNLKAGNPKDYIRTISPTTYTGLNTPAPRFEKFMSEIFNGDLEVVRFMQRLLGYGITGLSTEHKLPILYGEEGRNGKDTLFEVLAAVLGGGLASTGSHDLLLAGKAGAIGGSSPHLMDLIGARIKWVSETGENAAMNANQIKQLTGGGKIKARALYSGLTEFQPTHLLLMLTNHKPRVPSGGDAALWSRLLLIPFNVRFVDNPQKDNERPRDPYLKETLKEEGSGILAWLVRGCLAYQDEGLNPPESILAATEKYENEEDLFAQFIDEQCIVGDKFTVGSTMLFEAFKEATSTHMSQTKFGRKMAQKGFKKGRSGNGQNIYIGIGLRASE